MWMRGLTIKRVSDRDVKSQSDHLVIEKQLEVVCEGVVHHVPSTQGMERELSIGFAVACHAGHTDWESQVGEDGVWTLTKITPEKHEHSMSSEAVEKILARQDIFALTAYFQEKALLYKHTGITHSAAFATRKGLTSFAEDLYQMPAVYKALGKAILDKEARHILVVSGRVDLALVQLCIDAGVSILVSRTGLTDKAFDLAQEKGLTVVGFARGTRFNLYTQTQRIRL